MPIERALNGAMDAALAEVERQTAERLAAAKAATGQGRADALGISRDALNQRQRRANPTIKAAEKRANACRDAAYRRLAKRHPDEFLLLVQAERKKLNLPPLRPRFRRDRPDGEQESLLGQKSHGTKMIETVVERERPPRAAIMPDEAKQRACPHNMGLKKLPYGKFCEGCGKLIL